MNGVYFFKVAEMSKGEAFGELALMSTDNQRNATIQCETAAIFATLDKQSFDLSLQEIERRYNVKLVNFLSEIPCFKDMTKTNIHRFTYFLKRQKYVFKQVVYSEGTEQQYVYLIQKGEFELSKKLVSKVQNQPGLL